WLPESILYLVEKRPAGALEDYNKIGAKLGYPNESALPAARVTAGKAQNVVQMIFGGKMLQRTLLLWFGYACLMAAFYFANTWTPRLVITYLTNPANGGMELKAAQAIGNNAGVLVAVGGVVGALLFALLARRIHPRVLTAYTLLWGLAAYVIYANVFRSTTAALIAAVGVGIAANGGVAAFYAISPSVYPTAARGTGVGWMVGFGRIVSILAPIVSGYLIDGGMGSQTLYQIYGVILAIGAALVFVLHRSMKSDSTAMAEDTPAAVH
ncbi:MAG TPA: MFS transporter, partial [Dermatophilaceae bacterium]|nr:MFS transporter [Dermatophilaceae bacterium]